MAITDRLQRRLARDGEEVLLRRATAAPPAQGTGAPQRWQDWGWEAAGSHAEVTCKGLLSAGTPVQLKAEVWQVQRQLILGQAEIAAAAWPGPPRSGDQVQLADGSTHAVTACDTRSLRGVPIRHTLTILGDR